MRKPQKHAELIKAWSDGAEIEVYSSIQKDWVDCDCPKWHDEREYRIKREPKPDVVYYGFLHNNESIGITCCFMRIRHDIDNFQIIFDGETRKLKSAEVIK